MRMHSCSMRASVVGTQGQYDDGIWSYSWPWAIYLMKTGDLSVRKSRISRPRALRALRNRASKTRRVTSPAARTGPGGIMEATDDIDSDGYWTVDDFEALMGLAAYRYLAERVGDTSQVQWATGQYNSLLAATNSTLDATTRRFGLDYLPCSMVEPNTANRCKNAADANWAAPFQFGKWAWDAQLFDAPVDGPGLDLIDSTYSYGFDRLKGKLPPNTFGGYPTDYFSTGYNAGYGSWGLASNEHRDQGILSYEFMIENDQSGPYSWWESSYCARTLAVDRHAPGRRSRCVTPRMGYLRGEQGLARLVGRPAVGRRPYRRPGSAGSVVGDGRRHVGVGLPHHERKEAGHRDIFFRAIGHVAHHR